jgi:hypothetical protein
MIRTKRVRVFRYSFLNFPGYYLLAMCAMIVPHLFMHNPPSWLGWVCFTVALLPHWRAFIFFGQIGAVVSSRRIFIRGVTPRFGVVKANLILYDILPISNPFLRIQKAVRLSRFPGDKSVTLGYFSSDEFSFWSWGWLGVLSKP